MGPGDYHSGNVPATDGASLPPRKVVRSAVVLVRVVRSRIVRVDPDEGPVETSEVLKSLMAPETLKPLMAPEPFVAASELMPAPVPTITG